MTTDAEQLDREIDQARRRLAAAQMAIAEKLEIVEKQVRDTVAGAQSAIDDVVTNVKGTVSDTTDTLKRSLDVPYQTRRHPWLAFGSAVLVGYLLGGRGGSRRASRENRFDRDDLYRQQLQQGLTSGVLNQFKGEIGSLRSAAVGAIITALWEIAKQSLAQPDGRKAQQEISRSAPTRKPAG